MARYIDADYLDKLITQLNSEGRGITRNEYKMIDNILFEFPAADVVEKERYDRVRENANILADALSEYQSTDVAEVVRCKDCAYKQYYFTNDMVKCGCGNGSHHEDFFCADGERGEDD